MLVAERIPAMSPGFCLGRMEKLTGRELAPKSPGPKPRKPSDG